MIGAIFGCGFFFGNFRINGGSALPAAVVWGRHFGNPGVEALLWGGIEFVLFAWLLRTYGTAYLRGDVVFAADVQRDRLKSATEAAKKWKAHVILKGFHTILAAPDGSVFVNTTGGPALAKGGTGDVLTGVLAALTAQFGTEDWLRVLALGVFLHGTAGDILSREEDPSGILAHQVAEKIPAAREWMLKEIQFGG